MNTETPATNDTTTHYRSWEVPDSSADRAYILESWEQCLRVLRAMTPHEREAHFNMDFWGRKTPCGTVVCIAGACAFDSFFQTERGWGKPVWDIGSLRDDSLIIDREALDETFGNYVIWRSIFHNDGTRGLIESHDDAVRVIMVLIAEIKREVVSPYAFGMPPNGAEEIRLPVPFDDDDDEEECDV